MLKVLFWGLWCLYVVDVKIASLAWKTSHVATLALGSRPRQGVARLQAKRKESRQSRQRDGKVASQKEGSPGAKAKALEGCGPRGSLGVTTHSREFKEVWGSVREWTLTLPRQLPFWERESWWTPETSEGELKGQISMDCCALGTIGKLLERRCLKWAHIAHLDIWNTSYGQKKGRESKWQFDSRPLKVRNWPLPDVRFESATRRWKALDKSYNFRPYCNQNLYSGDIGVQSSGIISGLQLRSPGKNSHLDATSAASCKVYYKGEGGGFPQVRAVVSLVCPCCSWLFLAPKVLQLCTNHFVWVVCRPVWVNKLINSS